MCLCLEHQASVVMASRSKNLLQNLLASSSDGKMESVCLCWLSCRTMLSHPLLQEISDCILMPTSGITRVPKTGCRHSEIELKLMFGCVTECLPLPLCFFPSLLVFLFYTYTHACARTHTHTFNFSYKVLSSGKRVGSMFKVYFFSHSMNSNSDLNYTQK